MGKGLNLDAVREQKTLVVAQMRRNQEQKTKDVVQERSDQDVAQRRKTQDVAQEQSVLDAARD